jgi:large subunit ribosomal protein L18
MDKAKAKQERRARAHRRLRQRVAGTPERPRLSVFKSDRYIYVQVVDDRAGRTLVQASSREPELRSRAGASAKSKAAARVVGETIAERAQARGLKKVVFDRGGYVYHGRVKELADAARAKGLEF